MKSLFLLILIYAATSNTYAQDSNIDYVDNKLIVRFENTQVAEDYLSKSKPVSSVFSKYNVTLERRIWKEEYSEKLNKTISSKGKVSANIDLDKLTSVYELKFDSETDPISLGRKLSTLPGIIYAEPRFIYYTDELSTNDPITNDFVNFHNFPGAWEINQSSEEIIISIVDSGVNYNHEDLESKHWINEDEIINNGIDDDNNGWVDDYLGWDFWDSGNPNGSYVEDNDPFAINNPHGTHVAGIATAQPDNGIGLVGAGYNSRFMAVKAGGIPDDPSTSGDESRSIAFGYEGILYSVINGADIVNCSWGGGGFSAFGEDIVNMATEAGVLVIASSGNESSSDAHYPSGYENVLSVGALSPVGNNIASYSNYGTTVDVFAKGTIRSSVGVSTNQYATFQGTSMASPVVAGLASLIKARYPTWSPERIKQQIRTSSNSIDSFNDASFQNLLGTGSIDALTAVESPQPGIVFDRVDYFGQEGGPIEINKPGTMSIQLLNIGNPTGNLNVSVSSLSEDITFQTNSVNIGVLGTNQKTTIEIPFTLSENILSTLSGNYLVRFSDANTGYQDFKLIVFDGLQFDISDANNLAMSFSPTGNIGFFDPLEQVGGIGFVPNHQTANFSEANVLFEGGILFEANKRLANNIRTSTENRDQQFIPVEFYEVKIPGDISDADGSTTFVPEASSGLEAAQINLKTYSFNSESLSNSILLNYVITNSSKTLSLSEVYLGIFNDWDIGDFSSNSISYNSENDILIVQESGNSIHPLVAVATLANTSSVLAIDNLYQGSTTDYRFGLIDGFFINKKRNALRAGTQNTEVFRTDVSAVVATGPYFIPPQDQISVGFVYAFGETEQELIDQINTARAQTIFGISELNSTTENSFPDEVGFFQNYPNPFNPSTTFSFNLEKTQKVDLTIYNLLGQKVKTIINQELVGGIYNYSVSFNELSSGVYFAIFETESKRETIKLTLIK